MDEQKIASALSIASTTDPLILVILINGVTQLGILWLAIALILYVIRKKK